MNTTAENTSSTPAAPQYELMRTVARAGGGSSSSRSTFEGNAKAARKAQINELKKLKQTPRARLQFGDLQRAQR